MSAVRKCQCVGVRPVEYTKKSSGELVRGSEIYFVYAASDVEGHGAGRCFVYDRDNPGLKVNDKFQVFHDDFRNSFFYIKDE